MRDIILVPLLLTLNRFHTLFWCFQCWIWTRKCRLGSCYLSSLIMVNQFEDLLFGQLWFSGWIYFANRYFRGFSSNYFCEFNQNSQYWKKETIYAKVYGNKVFEVDYIMHKVKTADKQFRRLIFPKTFWAKAGKKH